MRASPFFPVLMGDSHGYDEWAQRIAGGDWIGHEVFYQAPLYPYLLGVIYAIGGRSLLLVRIIQVIIGAASCALLGVAASRLFSRPFDRAEARPELVAPRLSSGRPRARRGAGGRRVGLAAGSTLG